jgi:hypothetical protein
MKCAHCPNLIAIHKTVTPKTGDFALCRCGRLSILSEQGELREPTEAELIVGRNAQRELIGQAMFASMHAAFRRGLENTCARN